MYNLARAMQLASFFAAHNLFLYPNEASLWIGCAEQTVSLLRRAKVARDAAKDDAAKLYKMIRNRSEAMENLVASDLVLIAQLKAGMLAGIPYNLMRRTAVLFWQMQVRQANEQSAPPPPQPDFGPEPPSVGQIIVSPPSSDPVKVAAWFKAYFDKRQAIEEQEAKEAIRDASVMMLPYKGVRRRLAKLEHNFDVLDSTLDKNLYVASSVVKGNIDELVFKGLWNEGAQALFHRIVKTFIADRMWSSRAKERLAEWQAIWDGAKSVTTQQGRVFLQVVEQALLATGIAA